MHPILIQWPTIGILVYLVYFFISGEFRRTPEHLPLLISGLVAFWLAGTSYQHLSAEGAKRPSSVLWKGALASRSDFTAEGWRLRWRAAVVLFAGFLVSLVWSLARY